MAAMMPPPTNNPTVIPPGSPAEEASSLSSFLVVGAAVVGANVATMTSTYGVAADSPEREGRAVLSWVVSVAAVTVCITVLAGAETLVETDRAWVGLWLDAPLLLCSSRRDAVAASAESSV